MYTKPRYAILSLAVIALGLAADGEGARDGVSLSVGAEYPEGTFPALLLVGLAEMAGFPSAYAQAPRRDCRIGRGNVQRGTRRRFCVQRSPHNFGNQSDNNFDPQLTPDGRFVVFTSLENLDNNPIDLPAVNEDVSFDIFRQDLETGTLRRVAVDAAGDLPPPVRTPDATDPAKRCDPDVDARCPQLADSVSPAISANGRLVAFATDGAFLRQDTNNEGDVYLKNLATGRLTLVSAATRGGSPGPAVGGVPLLDDGPLVAMSDNGRFVAFVTTAPLHPHRDRNNALDVYVRDRRANRFFLASIDDRGMAGGVSGSFLEFPVDPAIDISANGRFVAFTSLAALDPTDGNRQADVYVWDRLRPSATPILVSGGAEPPPGFVDSSGFPRGPLSSSPALSADGRFIVFESSAALVEEDTNGISDIYRYERVAGRTVRASLDSADREAALEGSRNPTISAAGRFVAFSSAAGDLVLGDTSFGFTDRSVSTDMSRFPEDIFVKDLRTGAIIRASLDEDGLESDGTSFEPSLSADARLIAFITDDPSILEPLPGGGDRPGDSVVVTGVDFTALPVDDIPGAPPGAVSIQRNFGTDPAFNFGESDSNTPLNFALRNTIDRPGDQDWFRVSLFKDKTYVIDLEGRPSRQGTLDDPLLRIFVPKIPGVDLDLARQDDDGGIGLNARLMFKAEATGDYFISAESFGAATGTYRLLVREQ